jgi:hypothetical protein
VAGDRVLRTIKLQNNRVVLIDGKASCECCSCCNRFDIDFFLYGPDPTDVEFLKLVAPNPDTPPQEDWMRDIQPSCARWVCAKVRDSKVIETKQYGGPTTNNLDLTKVLWTHIPVPKESGCYIYRFDFYGWIERIRIKRSRRRSVTRREWRESSDTYYKIYKEVYKTTN